MRSASRPREIVCACDDREVRHDRDDDSSKALKIESTRLSGRDVLYSLQDHDSGTSIDRRV